MSIWAWTMPVLAVLVLLVLAWRIGRIQDRRAAGMLLGLLFMLVTLVLNSLPVYIAVDGALGGHNLAYWLVQVFWMISMVMFSLSFAHAAPKNLKAALWVSFGLAVAIGATGVALIPAEWGSVHRLAGHRDTLPALLLATPTNLVSAFAAVLVITSVIRSLRLDKGRSLVRSFGLLLVIAGFTVGLTNALLRLAAVAFGTSDMFSSADAVLVGLLITMISLGVAMLAVGPRRPA